LLANYSLSVINILNSAQLYSLSNAPYSLLWNLLKEHYTGGLGMFAIVASALGARPRHTIVMTYSLCTIPFIYNKSNRNGPPGVNQRISTEQTSVLGAVLSTVTVRGQNRDGC